MVDYIEVWRSCRCFMVDDFVTSPEADHSTLHFGLSPPSYVSHYCFDFQFHTQWIIYTVSDKTNKPKIKKWTSFQEHAFYWFELYFELHACKKKCRRVQRIQPSLHQSQLHVRVISSSTSSIHHEPHRLFPLEGLNMLLNPLCYTIAHVFWTRMKCDSAASSVRSFDF